MHLGGYASNFVTAIAAAQSRRVFPGGSLRGGLCRDGFGPGWRELETYQPFAGDTVTAGLG